MPSGAGRGRLAGRSIVGANPAGDGCDLSCAFGGDVAAASARATSTSTSTSRTRPRGRIQTFDFRSATVEPTWSKPGVMASVFMPRYVAPMEPDPHGVAGRIRAQIDRRPRDPSQFRATLASVPPGARDACLDRAFGLDELPADGPLPSGCVPYLPCPVDALLGLVEHAPVRMTDVFIDVGSGLGRAAALVHLLTGARAVGLEIQPSFVAAARALATRLRLPDVSFVEGDAPELAPALAGGSMFFLYCPFSGDRLDRFLTRLEPIARTRPIQICCVDLPLPARAWLTLASAPSPQVAIYRSAVRSPRPAE